MSRNQSQETKKRILQVCVKLFLEQGYKRTTMAEIIEKSGVSSSSFQNIFRAKDGVLTELVQFMFSSQFGAARSIAGSLPPVCVYAAETAIQLTLPELNEDDFYVLEIGSAGLMRGYMAQPCDEALTLEKKLGGFLTLSLRGYNVPKEQVEQALAFVQGLDIRTIACRIMQELFRALAMRYDFSPQGLMKETESR